MATYIALLRKDPDSDYGVDFPDFPGCITAGSTLDEAHKRAPEALQFHIEGMIEDGDPIPEASSLETIMSHPDHSDAVAFLVTVPDQKAKRINITLPEIELKAIDAYAKRHNLSRSAFLLQAAKQAMNG